MPLSLEIVYKYWSRNSRFTLMLAFAWLGTLWGYLPITVNRSWMVRLLRAFALSVAGSGFKFIRIMNQFLQQSSAVIGTTVPYVLPKNSWTRLYPLK